MTRNPVCSRHCALCCLIRNNIFGCGFSLDDFCCNLNVKGLGHIPVIRFLVNKGRVVWLPNF